MTSPRANSPEPGFRPAESTDFATTPPETAPPTPAAFALAREIHDLEHHVAASGWDAPIRVYALVRTQKALAETPELVSQIPAEAVTAAASDPDALLAIEQEELPEAPDLESLLAQLAWPDTVDGVALAVERFVVPPQVEDELPDDPAAQVTALMEHPEREDLRIVVGVLRTGESWAALRFRSHDSDDQVAGSSDTVPDLTAALAATLA